MHLIVTTPSGISLLFDAEPTGQISLCTDGLTVDAIEVQIFGNCARFTPTGAKPLDVGHANVVKKLWVRPDDLCDDGVPLKHEELRRAVEAAVETRRQDLRRSSLLGDNWP